jgi:hypothetical protein
MTGHGDPGPDDTQALRRASTMQIIRVRHERREQKSGDESTTSGVLSC